MICSIRQSEARLRQGQRKHPILQLRRDLLAVNFAGQAECAHKVADVVFRVDRLHVFVLGEVYLSFNTQHVTLQINGHTLLRDPRHLHDDHQAVVGLVDVSHRRVVAARNCSLFLCRHFLLLAQSQILRWFHGFLHLAWGLIGAYVTVIERGLSASARGRNSARMPSRHSAFTPSGSISNGSVMARSNWPASRSWRCTLACSAYSTDF